MKQKLRVFFTLLLFAVASVGWGDVYKKIISSSAFSTGQYLIVYEGESLALSGSGTTAADIKKGTKVKITNDQIDATTTTNAIAVLITASGEDKYLIQTVSGYYIYNTSSTNNGFSVTQNLNTAGNYPIAINFDESGNANIISSGNYLRYNPSASSPIFNFYKAASYSSQKAINLYKLESGGTPSLEHNDLALTGDPVALTFDLYNNSNAQTFSYTTSSTGAVTVSESEFVDTSVDAENKTITVSPKKKTSSAQTITVSQAADETYAEGSATFTVSITDSTPYEGGDVTFEAGTDLGTTTTNADGDEVSKSGVTISSTKAAFATSEYRLYQNSTTTISTLSGKITKIVFTKNSSYDLSKLSTTIGTYDTSTGTWTGNAESVEFSAAAQVRLDKIVVTVTPDGDLLTPSVTIDKTSFNIGETATVTTDGPAVTLSTSDVNIASVSGYTVTGVAAGTATITANWEANDEYEGGTKEFTVTVTDPKASGQQGNPYTVAQARAAIDAGTGVTGVYATGIVSEIVTAYNSQYGNITFNISANGSTEGDQLCVYRCKKGTGNNDPDVKDIQVGDVVVIYGDLINYQGTYEFTTGNVLVSLERTKIDPTIVVADATVAYGNTFTIDTEVIEGGEITVTSSNTSVATVNGLVITPVAVGQTTITVATAENAFYNAGSETFTLTVTAPTAMSTAAPAASGDFVKVTSTAGIKNGDYLIVYKGETELDNSVAFNGGLETLDAGNNVIEVTVSNDKIEANDQTKAATFKIDAAEGTLQSKSGYYIGVSSNNNGLKQTTDAEIYKNSFTIDNDGNAVISAVFEGSTMSLRFNSASGDSNNRFRYYKSGQQPIQLYKLDEESSIEVTLNSSGYATYCNQYPLDFTNNEEVTAWILTGFGNDDDVYKMNYTQITGAVKGGVGMLLKGAAGATVSLTSVNSDIVPSGNKFVGTLAPTFVEAGAVYGLSGSTFKKSASNGTVKANKAFIPASELPTDAKSFVFVFENEATGVRTIETVSAEDAKAIFNIAGQRLQNMQKGINIVGGKKILVK